MQAHFVGSEAETRHLKDGAEATKICEIISEAAAGLIEALPICQI